MKMKNNNTSFVYVETMTLKCAENELGNYVTYITKQVNERYPDSHQFNINIACDDIDKLYNIEAIIYKIN
jgi:hypothetical protein